MITAAFIALVIVLICFAGVLLFGAPYLPTLTPQVEVAFDLAGCKPGDHLLELGCGDGKLLIAAAQRGIRATGYELNPILFAVCWLRTWRYRKLIIVRLANFWRAHWPPTDVIFVFLLPKYMHQLDKKIVQYSIKPVKLVTFAFAIPGKKPSAERKGVMMYSYK